MVFIVHINSGRPSVILIFVTSLFPVLCYATNWTKKVLNVKKEYPRCGKFIDIVIKSSLASRI